MTAVRAAVLREFGKPLEVAEQPDPSPPQGRDVLVRVRACGLCSTDLKILAGALPPAMLPQLPHVLGHEGSGEIFATGPEVTRLTAGQRVAIRHSISCGHCRRCLEGRDNLCENLRQIGIHRHGCLAEFVSVPEDNLAALHDGTSYEAGCIISDAIASPVHAVLERGRARSGETVLVIGVGGLGLHALQVACLSGCRVIAVDRIPEKLELARSLGASAGYQIDSPAIVEDILRTTDPRGLDLVVDFVGIEETVSLALRCIAKGGRYVLVGYQQTTSLIASLPQVVLNEVSVLGSRASPEESFRTAVDLVNTGRVRAIVTDAIELDHVNDGLSRLREGNAAGRVVVRL